MMFVNKMSSIVHVFKLIPRASLTCSYGSWIYNYLCNQCISPLMLWVRISTRARCTVLCDKVCQWLVTVRWFSSTNKTDRHDTTEILLNEALSTINQRNKLIQTSSPPNLIYYYMCQTLPISCFSITFLQTLVYSGRVCNWKITAM
jgi:hypothetical protein